MSEAKEKRPPPLYRAHQRVDENGNKRPWPRMPKAPAFDRPKPRAPSWTTPYTHGRKDPLETLARMAGGTTFKVPDEGRGPAGSTVGVDDIAHALGFVKDPLHQRMALAMACMTVAEWASVQELAYNPLLKILRGSHLTRHLVAGPKRYRVRIVMHDVFHDLVGQRRVAWAEAAKRARMRRVNYHDLYEVIAGFLETQAYTGAAIACRALFGD